MGRMDGIIPLRLLGLLEHLRWSVFPPWKQHTVMLNLDQRTLSSMAPFEDNRDKRKKKVCQPTPLKTLLHQLLICRRPDITSPWCTSSYASANNFLPKYRPHQIYHALWVIYKLRNYGEFRMPQRIPLFMLQLKILCWVKRINCFWANIKEWKAKYMVGRGAEV